MSKISLVWSMIEELISTRKILQLRLTLTPLFTAPHAFYFSLTIFFPWSAIGIFFLFSIYVSDWFTVICVFLKNGKFQFPWIVIWRFFLFSEIPPPLKFSSMENVFKIHIDLNLQTFFICILGGPLMPPS